MENYRKPKKSVVVDTNVLMTHLDQLQMMDRDINIYVPKAVIDELTYLKEKEDLMIKAATALTYLQKRSANRDPRIGRCVLQSNREVADPCGITKRSKVSNDDKILHWALQLQKKLKVAICCFTQDVILQIKSIACGMNASGDNRTLLSNSATEQTLLNITSLAGGQIIHLIIDENVLIHRLSLVRTLVDQSESKEPQSFKFHVHIPWSAIVALDQLKVSNESVDVKMKASKVAHYLLDYIQKKTPWIHVQHMEVNLRHWLSQLKGQDVFILSEDLEVKFIMDIRVINEEKLLLMWFPETIVQNACRMLPTVPVSDHPWFHRLRPTIKKKKPKSPKVQLGTMKKALRLVKQRRKKAFDVLFSKAKTQSEDGLKDTFNLMLCDVYLQLKEFSRK